MDCNGLLQHIVGDLERIGKGDLLIGGQLQTLVGDDDQGVDLGAQLLDAGLSLTHTAGALKAEGLGDDADGQNAHLAGDVSHNGAAAGTGAAAHAGR